MKPYLERLAFDPDVSIQLLDRRLDDAIPFQWHHHPEFELTLTLNSRGERFIGDHVGGYDDGDLVLVGPNLPHTWASRERRRAGEPHRALVVWFHPDWIAGAVAASAELAAVKALISRGGRGIAFGAEAAAKARDGIGSLFVLSGVERLLALFRVLDLLARDPAARPLARAAPPDMGPGRERIDRVLTAIHAGYDGPVRLADLADIAALSLSGLHRMFRKHTGTTISAYVARLRIGDACARLSGSGQPVAHIADAVGYETLANFNRQFRAQTAMTPREYRRTFLAGPARRIGSLA